MAITVEFEELAGSPNEQYTSTGFQAVQRFKCKWSQRHELARQFKKGLGVVYGPNIAARATDVTIEPFFADEGKVVENPNPRQIVYSDALVTVTYRTPDGYSGAVDSDDPETLASESVEPWTEFITLPGRRLYWDSAHTQPLGDDVNPGMLIRGVNWVYTIYQVNTLLPAYFSLIGRVNSLPITSSRLNYTFPAGTLLFNPPSFQRTITSQGTKAWTVNLTFSYREKGWNMFYNIKNEMFQAVYVTGHSDPAEIYPSADFITEFGVGR